MSAPERDEQFWATHCWARRFGDPSGENLPPCAKPAYWRGVGVTALDQAWRACDDHRGASDVALEVRP